MFARKARIIKDLEEKLERANNRTEYWMNESAGYEIRLLDALSDNRQLKAENKKLKANNDVSSVYWMGRAIKLRMDCEKLKAENKKLKADNDSLTDQASSLWGEEIRKDQQIRLQNEMIETIAKDLDDANKRKADLSKCFGYWLCETLRLRRECENLKKKVEYLSQFEMPNTNCLCQIRN